MLIYIMSIGMVSYGHVDAKFRPVSQQENQTTKYNASGNYFLDHTIPAENFNISDNNSDQPNPPEDKFQLTVIIQKQFESSCNIAFKQYIEINNNRLIAYRKKDIIYPFHYYW